MPIPPMSVREEAQRGLDWRKEYNRGGTPVGWARARDLSNGVDIPPATLRRMVSFFARHEVDKQGRGYQVGSDGYPSRGRIAWALWGGDAGRAWALSQTRRLAKAETGASTPAPPEDQRSGSETNRAGSASSRSGDVTLDAATEKGLANKAKEHNAKMAELGKPDSTRVTIGALRAVYRRGSGAFSVSHRPGVTRGQWSNGRVNAFLYLARNGRPENPKYVGDYDLLDSKHPKYSRKSQGVGKQMAELEPTRRPALLRKLRITRVDRVAAGANPEAEIVLFKRAELDEMQTSAPEAIMLPDQENADASETIPSEEQTMSETLTADAPALEVDERIAAIEAERDALAAKVTDLEAAAQIVADPEETLPEVALLDEEAILKALDPSVRERIEKVESERAALIERVAKMEDDAATAEFVTKAAEFKTVNSDADRLGALLKDVAKNCAPESAVTLDEVLKGTAGRLDEAHRLITAELGSVAGLDSTDAGQRIESLAKARSAESGVSLPVATAAILNENPDLYEQARAQRSN